MLGRKPQSSNHTLCVRIYVGTCTVWLHTFFFSSSLTLLLSSVLSSFSLLFPLGSICAEGPFPSFLPSIVCVLTYLRAELSKRCYLTLFLRNCYMLPSPSLKLEAHSMFLCLGHFKTTQKKFVLALLYSTSKIKLISDPNYFHACMHASLGTKNFVAFTDEGLNLHQKCCYIFSSQKT